MAKAPLDLRIALFIDFENLVTRTGVTAESFDLQPTLDKLLEKGKVVFRRAYCDWGRFAAAKKNLHDKGVELIDVPPSTRSGKNGADMRLVIDALELAYLREHVDTFVIASGDSDFCPLAYKLRENNKRVIGVAVREATSPLFVKACDEFIYIRPVAASAPAREKAAEAPAPPAAPHVAAPAKAPAKATRAPAKKAKAPPAEKKPQTIPQVARDVVAAILGRATEPVNPSQIKQVITRQQPDFDVRDYGFSTFGRLLEAMEGEGLLKREKSQSGQLNIVPVA